MYRRPGEFGTIVMIQEKDPSFGRMKDTIIGALAQHRPTLIVTDADPDRFAFDPKIPDMPFEMPVIGYNSEPRPESRPFAGSRKRRNRG